MVEATDEEIDAIIAEFGGDARLAIRALLHDLTQIALDCEAAVSRGYVRGNLLPFSLREATDAEADIVTRRTSRSDSLIDRVTLLAALGACRGAVIREMTRMKVGGPLYYSGRLLSPPSTPWPLMLTGERDYFALKGHSIGGPKPEFHDWRPEPLQQCVSRHHMGGRSTQARATLRYSDFFRSIMRTGNGPVTPVRPADDWRNLFHPAVAEWFEERFAAPTAAQVEAWAAIKAGRHTLIAAPTGSGKTLAAFLAAIDDLVRQSVEGRLTDATQIVYVSPLKALSNDIHRNLEAPLAGIREKLEACRPA